MIPQLHFLLFCFEMPSITIKSSLCQTLGPSQAVSFYSSPSDTLQLAHPTRLGEYRAWLSLSEQIWVIRGEQAGVLCIFWRGGVAVVSLKNCCCIYYRRDHISSDKVWFTDKMFPSCLSSYFFFLLSARLLFFLKFAIHKIKRKATVQNVAGIKGQRSHLPDPDSPSPAPSFCLQHCWADRGSSYFPPLFPHWHCQSLRMPPKEDRFFPSAHFHKKHDK